jgi:hypothetical protein
VRGGLAILLLTTWLGPIKCCHIVLPFTYWYCRVMWKVLGGRRYIEANQIKCGF